MFLRTLLLSAVLTASAGSAFGWSWGVSQSGSFNDPGSSIPAPSPAPTSGPRR